MTAFTVVWVLGSSACGGSGGTESVDSAAELAAEIEAAGFGCADDGDMIVREPTSSDESAGELEKVECNGHSLDGDPEVTLYVHRFESSDDVAGFVSSRREAAEDAHEACAYVISGPNWVVNSEYYGEQVMAPLSEALSAPLRDFGDNCG